MIVNNKKVRLKVIPLAGCKKALAYYKTDELVLAPGFNEIPDEIWNELKGNFSNIRNYLKAGHLEEHLAKKTEEKIKVKGRGKKEETEATVGTAFAKLTNDEAVKVIEDTWDIKALKKFAKKDERADIRNLIDDKIKMIKKKEGDTE